MHWMSEWRRISWWSRKAPWIAAYFFWKRWWIWLDRHNGQKAFYVWGMIYTNQYCVEVKNHLFSKSIFEHPDELQWRDHLEGEHEGSWISGFQNVKEVVQVWPERYRDSFQIQENKQWAYSRKSRKPNMLKHLSIWRNMSKVVESQERGEKEGPVRLVT